MRARRRRSGGTVTVHGVVRRSKHSPPATPACWRCAPVHRSGEPAGH